MEKNTNKKLIYRSVENDRQSRSIALRTRSCNVNYYNVFELEPIDILIGELLLESESSLIDIVVLGRILGFDVESQPEKGMYYDKAEDNLFHKLLNSVQDWGIISIEHKVIKLTELGRVCLKNRKKYKFHAAKTDTLEFIDLKSNNGEAVSLFPFYSELGLSLSFKDIKTLKYDDDLCDIIDNECDDALVNNLKMQVPCDINIYNAEPTNYLGLLPIKLDVELYETDGHYSLNFHFDGNDCTTLDDLFELDSNVGVKERKVEQCLYYSLVNNPDAILNYKALKPFEDIMEVDLLIEDTRIDWNDTQLLQLIISQCNADRWLSLSKHCDSEVLKSLIPYHVHDLDWGTLTLRLDSQYISSHSKDYPWDKYTLFARTPVEKELIQQFLVEHTFPDGKDDGLWEWDEVIPVVGLDFIIHHLDSIPFELSGITDKLDDSQKRSIIEYPDARWDWGFIVLKYPLDFLVPNLDVLHPHINMQTLVRRIFTVHESAIQFVESQLLKNCILASGLNQRFNANNLEFIWEAKVIELFESCGLINWSSTTYQTGFECNPYLVWDEVFFQNYQAKVTTPKGWNWVSQHITNTKIVDSYPSFMWDKIGLSLNPIVLNNISFITSHWNILDPTTIVVNCDTDILEAVFNSLSDEVFSTILTNSEDIQKRLLDNLSSESILSRYSIGWNKTLFTERICHNIELDTLDRVDWSDMIDWNYLTSNLPTANIKEFYSKYADKWDHLTFAERVNDNDLLEENFLTSYAEIIEEKNLADSIWPLITSKFSANKLISLTKKYCDNLYHWDYSYMYDLPDFPAKEYIEDNSECVHWDEFSESNAANKLFSKTGANKTQSLWLRIYEDILNNVNYHWNFDKLSKLSNILKLPKLFKLEKPWNWEFISEHATWISVQKDKDYYFKTYIESLDFDKLSYRTDIDLSEEIIEKYDKKKKWNWNALVQNPGICFSFDYIDSHEDKPWDWHFLSHREGLPFEVVINHLEKDA